MRKYDSKVNSKKLTNIIVPMNKNKKTLLFSLLALSLLGSISIIINSGHSFVPRVYAARAKISPEGPIINDPNLVAQVVFKGLSPY